MRQRGFAHPRQVFNQQMSAGKQAAQGQTYLRFLAQQDSPHFGDSSIYNGL